MSQVPMTYHFYSQHIDQSLLLLQSSLVQWIVQYHFVFREKKPWIYASSQGYCQDTKDPLYDSCDCYRPLSASSGRVGVPWSVDSSTHPFHARLDATNELRRRKSRPFLAWNEWDYKETAFYRSRNTICIGFLRLWYRRGKGKGIHFAVHVPYLYCL